MGLLGGAEREEMTAALAALPSGSFDALAGGGEHKEEAAPTTETKPPETKPGETATAKDGEKPAAEGERPRGPDGKFLPKDKPADKPADAAAAPPTVGGKPADKPADQQQTVTPDPSAFTPGQNVEWARYEAAQKKAEEAEKALERLKDDNAALAAQMRLNREYGLGPTGQPVQQPQQQQGVSQEQVDRVLAELFPNEDVRSTLHPDVAKHLAEQAIWRNQYENAQRAEQRKAAVAAERAKLEQQITTVQTKYPRTPREVFVVALMQNATADLETVAEKFYRDNIVPIRQEGFAEAEAKYKTAGAGPQPQPGSQAVPPNVRTAPSGAGKPAGVAGARTDLPKKASERVAFVADLLSQGG